jgi:hypothetical protein
LPSDQAKPARNSRAGRHACILSLAAVADEMRVRHQAAALIERGRTVTVVGFRGRSQWVTTLASSSSIGRSDVPIKPLEV